VCTRFPPEPNGYLHIGHAKAICVDYGAAIKYGGVCNLRMDDTNPAKEDMEYVNSIVEDVKWLGFSSDPLYFASDYYDKLYEFAVILIKKGKAYVCDLTPDEIREFRGTLKDPGKESPCRSRSVEENLSLFEAMKNGEFEDGSRVLRAKIDMASPNINMRDPILYRVLRAEHYRTGNKWCIYPMYDFAHPLSDAIEGITHSICTLEFEDHRPLYDWFVQEVGLWPLPPRQIEFARLGITRTIMSKRYLKKLVDNGAVSGWDDPRMPTLCGLRRRGFTPESIRSFCDKIGVAKSNSTVDAGLLEFCVREDLGPKAPRMMAVIRPVKLTIENWPEGKLEEIIMENMPDNEQMGRRAIRFGREVYTQAFSGKLAAYTTENLEASLEKDPQRKISGNIAYYYLDKQSFYGDFPVDNPNEIDYIVLVSWDTKDVGSYTDGESAQVNYCSYYVLDTKDWNLIKKSVIFGSDPPSSKSASGPRSGSKPTMQDVKKALLN